VGVEGEVSVSAMGRVSFRGNYGADGQGCGNLGSALWGECPKGLD
jgi:hypothetical protein